MTLTEPVVDGHAMVHTEILRTLVGSTVHGLALADTDRDEMAVYVELPSAVLGPYAGPEHYTARTKPEGAPSGPGDVDLIAYALRKYLRMALAGNPSVLVPLFVPDSDVLVRTPQGDALRALAPHLLSRHTGWRHLGYLRSQRERMVGQGRQSRVPNRLELVERYGWDTKYGGHAVRLGLQGIEVIRTGWITLPMPEPDRQVLRAIRQGQVTKAECLEMINHHARVLQRLLEDEAGPLPAEPDRAAANIFAIHTHQETWGWT